MFQKWLLRIGYYPTRFRCHFLLMLAAVLSDILSLCSLLGALPTWRKKNHPLSHWPKEVRITKTEPHSYLGFFILIHPFQIKSAMLTIVSGVRNITLFYVAFYGKEHVRSPVRIAKRAIVAGWKSRQRWRKNDSRRVMPALKMSFACLERGSLSIAQ